MIIPEASGRCSSAATSIGACKRAWSQQKSSVKEAPRSTHAGGGSSRQHAGRERFAQGRRGAAIVRACTRVIQL